MSDTNKPLVAILDSIGRTIIGKKSNETDTTLSLENPSIVHVVPNQQTNQLQLQLIPIFFKELFEKYKGLIDTSVYSPTRVLYIPLSDRKKNLDVPELKIIKGSLFDCCATYIEEDYEDLDLRVQKIDEPKKEYIKQS